MSYKGGVNNLKRSPAIGAGTTVERIAFNGTLWVNLDTPSQPYWQRYNGTAWIDLEASAPTLPAWSLNGNDITPTDVLGTTNDNDIVIVRNNIEAATIGETDIEIDLETLLLNDFYIDGASNPMLIGGEPSLGSRRVRLSGSGTTASYVDINTFINLVAISGSVRLTPNNNAFAQIDYSVSDNDIELELGTPNSSANPKKVFLFIRSSSSAGVTTPELFIYASENTADGTEENIYLCHNNSKKIGALGIGKNSVDVDHIVDYGDNVGFGMFPPMTTAQRDARTAKAGSTCYNTTTNKHQGYDGTTWNDMY